MRKHGEAARARRCRSRLTLATVVTAGAALVATGATTSPTTAASPAPLRQAQAIQSDETGISAPAGIAYSPGSRTFHVVRRAGSPGAVTDVANVDASRAGFLDAGADRIGAALADPTDVAFDPAAGRLLALARAGGLLELKVAGNGRIVPGSLVRHDVPSLGLVAPHGVAVDPGSGAVFVLDSAQPRIVRLLPGPGGNLGSGASTSVDLRGKGLGNVRGLAFDPSSGHLFVHDGRTLYELTQAGAVVSTRDLSVLDLSDPQGMVFAPSGDETDAPATQSLYLADSGGPGQGAGQIVELSLQPQVLPATPDFTSALVRTVDTSQWSPPSPDPGGIDYIPATNRLMVSDSEVEETVQGITPFRGANVWETDLLGNVQRTANISRVQPTQVSMTDEPTGVAYNPDNGHYLFSDDNAHKVFDLNPGGDGLVGTADDSWTSFSTVVAPNDDKDCEGVAFDTANGHVFTSDGVNAEIYEYTQSGTLVSHFDVAQYGVQDNEGVSYNPANDHLYVLSNRQSGPIIVETTTSGALVQTIDASAETGRKPADLTLGPASDGSGGLHFYIADRGIDNNNHPTENDGKLFELTAPQSGGRTNQPPTVDAGLDQQITLPAQATLNGTVTDDGLPNPPAQVTTTWSETSGPGAVTFGDASAVDTTATFSQAGTYVLRLTASDSQLSSFDEVTITVSQSNGGDVIFSDGFESGDFSAWSSATTGGGDLSVTSAAAQSGTKGMQATINDTGPLFVTDATPAAEPRYRARFWFDPNGIVMASGDRHTLFDAQDSSGTTVLRVELQFGSKQYQVRAGAAKDGAGFPYTPWFTISNGWHAIELDWLASSAPGANSGSLTLWIDGVQKAAVSAIDNDTRRVDTARLGAVDGLDAGTSGTEYFDAFVSHRQTYIGP